MPVDVRYQVPFMPQEGITQQILTAIQLANEQHVQNQQLALRQQAQPSEIAERTAQAGLATAETAAIPQRLALQRKEIEANEALREATLKATEEWHKGMLGLGEAKLREKTQKDANDLELAKMRNSWQAHRAAVENQGTLGTLKLRQEALQNLKTYQGQELTLREQANKLREQGNETAAQAMITRADAVANQAGFWRTALGEIGAMPEVKVPPAAGGPTVNPKAPKTWNPATGRYE